MRTAYMGNPDVSIDGVLLPDSIRELSFRKYVPDEILFGSQEYPLNLYASDQPKPFDPTGPSNEDILDMLKG